MAAVDNDAKTNTKVLLAAQDWKFDRLHRAQWIRKAGKLINKIVEMKHIVRTVIGKQCNKRVFWVVE